VIRFAADWILPISDEPILGGCVAIERDRIVAVDRAPDDAVHLGRVVLLPALVNAHTHLELSYLHRRIPPAGRFLDWIRPMLAARRERVRPDDPMILRAAQDAITQARASGTALVGDVSNTLVTVPLLRDADMSAQVFYELIGFGGADAAEKVAAARATVDVTTEAESVRISLAPHAPYSVSPALFSAIRRDVDAHAPAVSSVHLGESPEEIQLLKDGTGPWRGLLEEMGAWNDAWQPPQRSPVEYLEEIGFLDRSVLVVHGVQFRGTDLARLRERGVTVVSCPRSNQYVGVGAPPLEGFYAMDLDVAFGTDSLASVEDVNMFAELAAARRIAPRVRASTLLRSATLCGARALGFGAELGSIERGKRAALIAVRVPDGVNDVEEYLVSGIEPGAVTWVGEATLDRQLPTSTL
jgi:cytosine/adenosine deaminase-related metal-dependent hydrolase